MMRPHPSSAATFTARRARNRQAIDLADRRLRERRAIDRLIEKEAAGFTAWLANVLRSSDQLGDLIEALRAAERARALPMISGWSDLRRYAESERLDLNLCAALWDAFTQAQRAGRVPSVD